MPAVPAPNPREQVAPKRARRQTQRQNAQPAGTVAALSCTGPPLNVHAFTLSPFWRERSLSFPLLLQPDCTTATRLTVQPAAVLMAKVTFMAPKRACSLIQLIQLRLEHH